MGLGEILLILSVLFLLASMVIVASFVVPLQIEQAQVKNGLSRLRKLLLVKGIIYLVTSGIAAYFIGSALYRIFFEGGRVANINNALLVFAFSLGYLILSVGNYMIYHIKYIEEYQEPRSRKTTRRNKHNK